MRNYIYILSAVTFLFSSDSLLIEKYTQAQSFRKSGDYDICLDILFDLEKTDLKYNYDIADIYLNDFSNHSIALKHFNKILINVDFNSQISVDLKKIYKKSLFMSSYIYSNYLGMYTDGYDGYKLFLELFPEEELSGSVNYEVDLLEEKELAKNKLLNK